MFHKILFTIALLFCLTNIAGAQTYYQVTAVNSSQVLNGVTVTVTAIAGAGTSLPYCGSAGPYWIGNGLTPVNFNVNPVKTRPTATIGANYDVEKNAISSDVCPYCIYGAISVG